MEVHRDGFRAEHARVEALAVPDGAFPGAAVAVREAAERLGVPLLAHDELRAFADGLGGVGVGGVTAGR